MKEVEFLITELRFSITSDQLSHNLFNNVAYYTPKIRDVRTLRMLIQELFKVKQKYDPKLLLDTTRAIFFGKLQISEPYITVTNFCQIWDQEIKNCNHWNINCLSLLAGILSTQDYFQNLQESLFIDGKGIVLKMYHSWRQQFFIPIWCQLLNQSNKLNYGDEPLILVYAMVHSIEDISDRNIPFNLITNQAIRMFTKYVNQECTYLSFWDENLNQLAKILQLSIPNSDNSVVNKALDLLDKELSYLSIRQLGGQKNTDALIPPKYYSNILLTTVLTFLPMLENIPSINYLQMLKILCNINFIALDFGTTGFQTYEIVYEILCVAITGDILSYMELLKGIFAELMSPLIITPNNRINDPKIIFLLNFIERTSVMISTDMLMNILPLQVESCIIANLNCPNNDIRELAHSIMLQILTIYDLSNLQLQQWQLKNIEPYLNLSIDQYKQGLMTGKQLVIVFKRVSSCMESLAEFDMGRIILQKLYLTFVNLPLGQTESRLTILKCIIVQIPYITDKYLINWLDNILEIIDEIPLRSSKENMMKCLWEEISNSSRMIALRWWYKLSEGSRSSKI